MKPRTFIRKDENGKEKVIAIQPRRVMRSLLPGIKQLQSEETYNYAKGLFDEMDRLEKEIDEKEERIHVCNKILGRLVFTVTNVEDIDETIEDMDK